MSRSETKSEREHVRHFLHKTCKLRSFWKFHVEVVQNNCKEMYKKKCAARAKLLFLLLRPVVVFHHSPALPSPLNITRFYILFEQTINSIESFAFSPG